MHAPIPMPDGQTAARKAAPAEPNLRHRDMAAGDRPGKGFATFLLADRVRSGPAASGSVQADHDSAATDQVTIPDSQVAAPPSATLGHDTDANQASPVQDPAHAAAFEDPVRNDTPATGPSVETPFTPAITQAESGDVSGSRNADKAEETAAPALPPPVVLQGQRMRDPQGAAVSRDQPRASPSSAGRQVGKFEATAERRARVRQSGNPPGATQQGVSPQGLVGRPGPQSNLADVTAKPVQDLVIRTGIVPSDQRQAGPLRRTDPPARGVPAMTVQAQAAPAAAIPHSAAPQFEVLPHAVQTFSGSKDGEAEAGMIFDTRAGNAQAASQQPPQSMPRMDLPQQIAMQIAAAAGRAAPGAERRIELTLNPEELGSVRLSLQQTEDGLSVSVLADRPETLDLLRRHIDSLAREFLAIGYESAEFTFGRENPGSGDQKDEGKTVPRPGPRADADGSRPATTAIHLMDRLDIRL